MVSSKKVQSLFSIRGKKNSGFALLEYCAGAAVILTVLWGALNVMGGNVSGLLGSIGNWATTQAGKIPDGAASGTKTSGN